VVFLLPHSCTCVCLCVCLIIECLGLQVAVGGSRGRLNEFIGLQWMMLRPLAWRARCRLPRSTAVQQLYSTIVVPLLHYILFPPFFSSLFFFSHFPHSLAAPVLRSVLLRCSMLGRML